MMGKRKSYCRVQKSGSFWLVISEGDGLAAVVPTRWCAEVLAAAIRERKGSWHDADPAEFAKLRRSAREGPRG